MKDRKNVQDNSFYYLDCENDSYIDASIYMSIDRYVHKQLDKKMKIDYTARVHALL